jgi:hypothetical protein
MAKLDQLEKDVLKAQEKIEKLQDKKAKAQAAVMDDPDNEKAALEAAAAEMQVKAAGMAKQRAQEAVQAEKRRLYQDEVDQAREKVAALEKEADKIQAEGIALIRAFYDKYHKFVEVATQYQDLASKYKIDHKPLIMQDRAEAGLDEIHRALIPWYAQREHVEYRKQHPR